MTSTIHRSMDNEERDNESVGYRTADGRAVRVSHLFICVALVLASLSVAGMIWVLRQSRTLPGVSGTITVLWATPTVTDSESYPGQLVVKFGNPKSLIAPAWNGVVTSVARDGTVVEDGTALVAIDGISRTVCSASSPLYRPLGLGDAGADVLVLRDCLAAITGEYATPVDASDVVDKPLVAEINSAADIIGAPATGVFDPDWVIWTPSTGWTVGHISASVGQDAPSAGSPFVFGEAGIKGAYVTPINASLSLLQDAQKQGDHVTFSAAGVGVAINGLGIPRLSALRRLLRARFGSGAGGAGSVTVSGTIDVTGPRQLEVPQSALLVDGSGESCVVALVSGEDVTIPVTATAAADQGNVIINGDLTASTVVALNPYDIPRIRSC